MISSEAGSEKGDNITQREKVFKGPWPTFPHQKKSYEQEVNLLGDSLKS